MFRNKMTMALLGLAAAALVVSACAPGDPKPAMAQSTEPAPTVTRTISVSGTAQVLVVPDQVELRLGDLGTGFVQLNDVLTRAQRFTTGPEDADIDRLGDDDTLCAAVSIPAWLQLVARIGLARSWLQRKRPRSGPRLILDASRR